MKPNLILLGAVIIAFIIGLGALFIAPPGHASGLWHGTFDINGRGAFNLRMLQIGDRLFGVSEDAKVAYQGSFSLDEGRYSAKFKMYFINGNAFDIADIMGRLQSGDAGKIDARFVTRGAGDKGALQLRYLRDQYERPTMQKEIAGAWILYQGYRIIKLNIDDKGGVSGGDTDGCEFKGSAGLIDKSRNAFRVSLFVSSCDRMDGEFKGMAWLASSLKPDDTLNIYAFDPHEFEAMDETWNVFMPMVRNDDTKIIDDGKKPV